MTTTLTPPSGFTPRTLTSWNRYFIPQSDPLAYRVGDAVKSAGGTDAAGVIAVTLHLGTGPARGVIVAVDPGLPATGGLIDGIRASVPATKLAGYYVWVDDDPSHQFAMVDDGLTPANSVPSSAGKYANFTPGATAAANGGSTASILSSSLGSTSGCLQVLSLQPGSNYGAAATWLVKFAAHELANGGTGTVVSSGAISRSTAQLAGTPSSADIALGANGQFYDPLQTVDSTHPWVYYSATATAYVKISSAGGATGSATPQALGTAAAGAAAASSHEDHVHAMPTALQVGGFPQISGNYDASTNTVLTGPLTGVHLASGTVPAGGPPAFKVTFPGTPGLDAVGALGSGDYLFQTGTVWDVAYGVPPTTALKRGNGTGGLTDAVQSVDYGAPIVLQSNLEVYMPSSGSIANNGALTLTTALQNIMSDGCWMTFPVNSIAAGIPATAGMKYWVVMSSTTVGQIFNNTYTPGTNLPSVPSSPSAFVTTGPGAFTQVVATDVTAYSLSVPANSMGPNGSIDIEIWGRSNNSAGAKAIRCFFGGQNLGPTISMTTGQQQSNISRIANKQRTNRQKNNSSGRNASGNASTLFGTVDTTAAQTLNVNFNLAVATDWVCIDEVRITVNYGA